MHRADGSLRPVKRPNCLLEVPHFKIERIPSIINSETEWDTVRHDSWPWSHSWPRFHPHFQQLPFAALCTCFPRALTDISVLLRVPKLYLCQTKSFTNSRKSNQVHLKTDIILCWHGDCKLYETGRWQLLSQYMFTGTRSSNRVVSLLTDNVSCGQLSVSRRQFSPPKQQRTELALEGELLDACCEFRIGYSAWPICWIVAPYDTSQTVCTVCGATLTNAFGAVE